jgi:hypothetical protein
MPIGGTVRAEAVEISWEESGENRAGSLLLVGCGQYPRDRAVSRQRFTIVNLSVLLAVLPFAPVTVMPSV